MVVGLTWTLPESATPPMPWSTVTDVVFFVDHDSVDPSLENLATNVTFAPGDDGSLAVREPTICTPRGQVPLWFGVLWFYITISPASSGPRPNFWFSL